MIDPSLVPGLANSGVQLAETRSTLVNLFHLRPLLYEKSLGHTPDNVAWGHAHCNTFLGQRESHGWDQLEDRPRSLNLRWAEDNSFIRAEDGRAWISITPMASGPEPFTPAFDTPEDAISDGEEED